MISKLCVCNSGMDLLCELDDTKAETSVHLAITEHGDSFQALAILEFIIQNSPFSRSDMHCALNGLLFFHISTIFEAA